MRLPSSFFDVSSSLSRLRTTPAKKPRTECCCQPVASIIAEIVAPAGECSIAKTRDCFVAESGLFGFATLLLPGAFVAELCGPDPADFAALAALPAASGFVAEVHSILRLSRPPKPHYGEDAGGAGSQSVTSALN